MTYDVYRYIFIGAAILCGILFAVSVLLFFTLKIPKIISDLTGATARKAIKQIREQNEASGDKAYKVSAFNEARGKLTDKISPSGNVIQQSQMQMRGVATTKIETQQLQTDEGAGETSVLSSEGAGETSVLSQPEQGYGETSVLSQPEQDYGETSVLSQPEQSYGETSVLSQEMGETATLSQDVGETATLSQLITPSCAETVDGCPETASASFVVEFEITYIHSAEVIA